MKSLVRGLIVFTVTGFCVVNTNIIPVAAAVPIMPNVPSSAIMTAGISKHGESYDDTKSNNVTFSIIDGTAGTFSGDVGIKLLNEETNSSYVFTYGSEKYKDGILIGGHVAEGKYKIVLEYQNKDKFEILNADATSISYVEVERSGYNFNWIISTVESKCPCADIIPTPDNGQSLSGGSAHSVKESEDQLESNKSLYISFQNAFKEHPILVLISAISIIVIITLGLFIFLGSRS